MSQRPNFRFSAHYVDPLFSLTCFQPLSAGPDPQVEQSFRDVDAALRPPFSRDAIGRALDSFQTNYFVRQAPYNKASEEILDIILKKILLGLYANALDLFLHEASMAQGDAEWWAEVEQSNWSAAMYLLQTFPRRIFKVFRLLKSREGGLHPPTLCLSNITGVLSTRDPWQPSMFMMALFPHLRANSPSSLLYLSFGGIHRIDSRRNALTYLGFLRDTLYRYVAKCVAIVHYPFYLAREECHIKRRENERLRDEQAEVLGKLLGLKPGLIRILETEDEASQEFLVEFASAFGPEISRKPTEKGALPVLNELYHFIFTAQEQAYTSYLLENDLRRPSRLTRIWPRLLFLPPLALYCVKTLYASRATLIDLVLDAIETSKDFIRDWLLEPLRGVYRTIRAGGDQAVIVQPESVAADLDSLERMSLALARDKLGYGEDQLAELSRQIRRGDLTPVLKLYEEDIKSPVKSVLSGTLLRTLFVQVQKAKVDIDQALAGIDKLLKSQELTFAFVGVAPSFAIVYTLGGFLGGLFTRKSGKYGGKRQRQSIWLAMRRIERLLLLQPRSLDNHSDETRPASDAIPPLTSGLLVLSLTHLRNYALTCLPARSRLREGFLEDVQDLENPTLGRWEKLRVLDGMWKNWAHELEWHRTAGV
ncbi:hypothetical protein ID866_3530 [Astraeus odoratus]|nr:hypothetical protein ID866_3530 [Astraeus odoratus]